MPPGVEGMATLSKQTDPGGTSPAIPKSPKPVGAQPHSQNQISGNMAGPGSA